MKRFLMLLIPVWLLPAWTCPAAVPAATNGVTSVSILSDLRYGKVRTASLLAVVAREDDRPWYVDDALLVLQLPNHEWMLVHAVRNPKFPPGAPARRRVGSTKWHRYHVMDAPHVGDRRFNHPPTRKEVDRFLSDNEWQFESDKFWRVVRRFVDEEAWQRVLGYKPFRPAHPEISVGRK